MSSLSVPPVVIPTAPPTVLPVTLDHEYHPDHPGPLGRLIHALHSRIVALEIEVGIREKPKPVAPITPVVAPVSVAPVSTPSST